LVAAAIYPPLALPEEGAEQGAGACGRGRTTCEMTGVSKSRIAYLPLSVSPGPGEREVSIGG